MLNQEGTCPKNVLSIKDALEALEGRWKLLILFSLYSGSKRFNQIAKEVNGISDRTLSKELKSLESNQLITREVHNTFPPTIEYSLTEHAKTLEKLVDELQDWGTLHRRKMLGR